MVRFAQRKNIFTRGSSIGFSQAQQGSALHSFVNTIDRQIRNPGILKYSRYMLLLTVPHDPASRTIGGLFPYSTYPTNVQQCEGRKNVCLSVLMLLSLISNESFLGDAIFPLGPSKNWRFRSVHRADISVIFV